MATATNKRERRVPCDVVSYFLVRMGFFRKIAGFLGLSKDHGHEEDEGEGQPRTTPYRMKETGPRKGFSVPAQVVLDRPHLAPILTPSTSGDGGVQGLRWHAERLRIDEDGDVADEFLDEVSSETSTLSLDHHKTETRFEHKGATRPAKVKQQFLSEGKLMHFVEHGGRFLVA
ncbi:unnamed protein product [Lupinus luteus]|uniref:Uncharacterized protein n=1 Tax=Lupinus luteus TaxID=3873 RepID=A0AAV1X001_LUPLU